jgi:MFS family permease
MIKIANNLQKLAWITESPFKPLSDALDTVGGGIVGAGSGGLIGGGIGALIEHLKKEQKKNYLKAILIGAGAGVPVGGIVGASLARSKASQNNNSYAAKK